MTKNKRKIRVKWKNVFKFFSLVILFTFLLTLCSFFLLYYRDYRNTDALTKQIKDTANITSIVDDEMTITIPPTSDITLFSSYWTYIKLGLSTVDFTELKETNPDIVGWLEIKGLEFSYPVTKSHDNEFYKTHSFDKKTNRLGSLYLDYRIDTSEMPLNTMIYGNKLKFSTLLGRLKDVYKEDWINDDNKHIIKFVTENFTALYEIISIYKIDNINLLPFDFTSTGEYAEYLEKVKMQSEIDFKTEVLSTDKIITIAETGKKKNIVVVAKLLKYKKL